jgi:hypothetical protein
MLQKFFFRKILFQNKGGSSWDLSSMIQGFENHELKSYFVLKDWEILYQ